MSKMIKQLADYLSPISAFFHIALACFIGSSYSALAQSEQLTYPELDEVEKFIKTGKSVEGVIFVVYEDEYDALEWVMPRLDYYIRFLRNHLSDVPIAIVAHGDEIMALTLDQETIFPEVHNSIKYLKEHYAIPFHVCGAYASLNGLSNEDFPGYIDVVPYGPAQIADYRMVGYEMVDIGLTW
jgi:intracellular sulfur oxidation DsrE/DsrF family protein